MYHSYPFLLIPCIVKTAYSRKNYSHWILYIYPNLIENSRLLSGNCLRMIDVSRDKKKGFFPCENETVYFQQFTGLILHCTLHFLCYILVYDGNSLISSISSAYISVNEICIFFIIIIICPQAYLTASTAQEMSITCKHFKGHFKSNHPKKTLIQRGRYTIEMLKCHRCLYGLNTQTCFASKCGNASVLI